MEERQRALLGRKPGRVLDVGCGDGDFLAALKQRGWEVHGVEPSPAAAALARGKGVAVHEGELASTDFPAGSFDVVTFWHVLEHLPEPLVELAAARRLLRDDGLLVVEVPNSASVTFRLCREHWFPLSVPRHFQHFTSTTLRALLQKAGFTPVRRRDFHLLDFLLSFMSFMSYLRVLGGEDGTHYFVSDYRKANWVRKLMFLILSVPVCVLAFPYSVITTFLARAGETITVTARKSA
jgi:SAM-dependent methyltransferase